MTASSTLAEDYLHWLEPQLRDEHGNPGKTYWELLNIMFETEFVYVIDMDDNRLADAMELRAEFAKKIRASRAMMLSLGPCSFLEVLIGLSRRLEFAAGGSAPGWAWHLLDNLELRRMSDPLSRAKQNRVRNILETAIRREYSPDGQGGFFPLAFAEEDQTTVELWYQMHAFIEELHPEH